MLETPKFGVRTGGFGQQHHLADEEMHMLVFVLRANARSENLRGN